MSQRNIHRVLVWSVVLVSVACAEEKGGPGGTAVAADVHRSAVSAAQEMLLMSREAGTREGSTVGSLWSIWPPAVVFPEESGGSTTESLRERGGVSAVRSGLLWSSVQGPDTGPDGQPGWYWWPFSWGSVSYKFFVKAEPAHDFRQGWPDSMREFWWGWAGASSGLEGAKFIWHQVSLSEKAVTGDYEFKIEEDVATFLGEVLLAGTWEKGRFDWTFTGQDSETEFQFGLYSGAHVVMPWGTMDGFVGSRGNRSSANWTWTYYEGVGSSEVKQYSERPAWNEGQDPAGPEWAKGMFGEERGGLLQWIEFSRTDTVENGATFTQICWDSWSNRGTHFHECIAPSPLYTWPEGCFASVRVVKGDYSETDIPSTAETVWALQAKRMVLSSPLRHGSTHPAAKVTGPYSWLQLNEPYTVVLGQKGGEAVKQRFVGGVKTLSLDVQGGPCDPPVASVKVGPATAEIEQGKTLDLTARALDPQGQTVSEVEFVWTVDAPSVAKVGQTIQGSATATVEGVKAGQTRIWAMAEGVWGYTTLTVKSAGSQPPSTEFEFGQDELVSDKPVSVSPYVGLAHLGDNLFFLAWTDQQKLYYDIGPSTKPDVEQPSTAEQIDMGPGCVLTGPQNRVYVVWNGINPMTYDWEVHISELEPAQEREIRDHRLPFSNPYVAVACAIDVSKRAYLALRAPESGMSSIMFAVSDDGLLSFAEVGSAVLNDVRMVGGAGEAYVIGISEGVRFQKIAGKSAPTEPVLVASATGWPYRARIAVNSLGQIFVGWTLEEQRGVIRLASSENGKDFGEPADIVRLEEGWSVGPFEMVFDEMKVLHVFYYAYRNEEIWLYHVASADGVTFSKAKKVNDVSRPEFGGFLAAAGGSNGAAVLFGYHGADGKVLFDLAEQPSGQ